MRKRKGKSVVFFEGKTIVNLYNTNVLVIDQVNQKLKLNSGGWRTNHTKNCINDHLPSQLRLFQKNFDWFIETPEQTLEFEDNMEISLIKLLNL